MSEYIYIVVGLSAGDCNHTNMLRGGGGGGDIHITTKQGTKA